MARTVLYGGTFNPIHNGHLALCRFVLQAGGFDRILLVPAAAPPHKDAPRLAEGDHRLAMCRMAVAELPGVEVLDWEILQGGKSYTVDTLHHLREEYQNDTFALLMGSDMFLSFCQWRQWQEIGRMADLLVASREADDQPALAAQQAALAEMGITSRILHNPVLAGSSTEVRRELLAGETSGFLPPAVAAYIQEHRLYAREYDLDALLALIKPLQKPERYTHSLCVAQRAAELALHFGTDANQAAAAGLLHDICKNMPTQRLLQILGNNGIITDTDFESQPQLLHGCAGEAYLRELGFDDKDLLNAVRYHTTGRGGMSQLEKIIYLADLTSSERIFPESGVLRALSDESLDQGMLWSLTFMVEKHLPKKHVTICRDTMDALAECRSRLKQEDTQ